MIFYETSKRILPISLAELSKEWVCGRSLAEIASSSPAVVMDICLVCCVLSGRGLCDVLITRSRESYRIWCA